PTTTPKATNLKALQVGKTTPQTTPPTTHINNNVLNKLKESDRQANLSHLKSAFEHIWKKWKSCKSNIGKTDTSPKTKTFDKNFKSIFNTAYFNKNSQAVFKAEINQLSKFIEKAHEIQGFNRFENMQLPKFLNEKQWRD
ncbi:MAG: tRNA nucleotidyltransferase/poly(A) polymerase, partial [Paraglaciecola sp.]